MTRFLTILCAVALLLPGCKATQGVVIETHEKVKVITHTELVPVVATFKVPEMVIEKTVKDSSSHLETDFAESDARVNSDGTLFHSLKNKKQTLQKEIEVKVEYQDSIVYTEKEVPVYVEKELTKWQKARLDGFWWLLAVVLIAVAYKTRKIWLR